MNDINEKISWKIPALFSDLSPDILDKLRKFNDEILRVNKDIELVSLKTQPFLDLIHFCDCIFASRIIRQDLNGVDSISDFGNGSGFPGVVFAILYPEIRVDLIEPDLRKCDFLKSVGTKLDLRNLTVRNLQIENLPENSISNCMARGFASISKSLLIARKIVKSGGSLYHFKGEEWGLEVADIPTQLCSFWSPSLVGEYRLPIGDVKFAIVKTQKTR